MSTTAQASAGQPYPGDDELLDRLRARLQRSADQRGLLDVAYRTLATPVGSLLLAATAQGLVRVAFEREGHDSVLSALATTVSPRVLRAPARLDDAVRQLDEYFARQRGSFDLPLDLRLVNGFRRVVVSRLADVRYGTTASYTTLAASAGRPRAVRAAASACATNPLPVVLPCHRILRADGTLGGYLGGLSAKEELLRLEGFLA